MTGRAMVRVGDVINAELGDFQRTVVPAYEDSIGDLHLRVTHAPMDAGAYDTEWVAVLGIEKPMGRPELPEAEYVIRRSVLLDAKRAVPKGPLW